MTLLFSKLTKIPFSLSFEDSSEMHNSYIISFPLLFFSLFFLFASLRYILIIFSDLFSNLLFELCLCCYKIYPFRSDQNRSVAQLCPTLCDLMNCSMPGLPVHHQLPEFTQTHVHWVSDAIQPSHPLSSPSPLAPNPSQHQSLFQWVNSSHEVAKVLEFQL